MKILYDSQIFTQQKFGGISRVFFEIIKKSTDNELYESNIPIKFNNNYYLKNFKNIKMYNIRGKTRIKGKNFFVNKVNRYSDIKSIMNGDFDIFHPTYYDTYFLRYLKKPFVLTVHDMIHENFFGDDYKIIEDKKMLIDKANKIIAISENTKKDIIKYYGVSESKIEVVYWANSLKYLKKIAIPEKYILFVGRREGYKNFNFILDSLKNIFLENKVYLICAGGGSFTDSEKIKIKLLGLEKYVEQISVEDSELAYLYKNAITLIFPSKYEGFGIPILEAFSFECPVVLSNTSCFPEIAKEAGIYFDPNNEDELRQVIERVIGDSNYRNKMIEKGKKINKEYSWERTIKKYEKIYRSLL